MTEIALEIQRDGEWKPTSHWDASVSVNQNGGIVIVIPVGYLQPPWRVSQDGAVLFERTA